MSYALIKIQADQHPVKSVTVFKSSEAEVVRKFSVDLQSGQNRIEIGGLSNSIHRDSVRVSGLGDNARLFDVVCTISTKNGNGVSEGVRLLMAKKNTVEGERQVRQCEADILLNYGRSLRGEHVSPEQMTAFLDKFVARGHQNLEATAQLDAHLLDINRQIEKETSKTNIKNGAANAMVVVVIAAEAAGPADLKLTYMVSNTNWESTYDLHATTEDGMPSPQVHLQYRARITQCTGEDWNDTALTLSTAKSEKNPQGVPHLSTLEIIPTVIDRGGSKPRVPPSAYRAPGGGLFGNTSTAPAFGSVGASSAFGAFGQASGASGTQVLQQQPHANIFGGMGQSGHDLESEPEILEAPSRLSEPAATVNVSPLAMSYQVEGAATIPSDNEAHQVSIAILSFEAKVTHVTVPRVKAVAYLQCQVKNTSDYRLLPGPVTIFLDDSYVSNTSIQDISTGDTFECTLGVDSSIRLSYIRTPHTVIAATGAFSEQFKTTTYTVTTTIHNKHNFAISELVVRDAIPLAEDQRIKVILRKPTGLSEAKEGDAVKVNDEGLDVRWSKLGMKEWGQKEGRYEWLCAVEGDGEVTTVAEYEIKTPADLTWKEIS